MIGRFQLVLIPIHTIGETSPEMQVDTTHGQLELPDHYKGKWFILFSHPGDFTPVCTTELAAFATRHGEFGRNRNLTEF
ncbi:MAG: redoxin domain-containing protein [Candidatus Thorarchaeota archaeon]|nr:redoxin domain-containing protein [Candidatus Thorarchaeota archaeon]